MHDALDHCLILHRLPHQPTPAGAGRNLRRIHHGDAADDWDTCARRG